VVLIFGKEKGGRLPRCMADANTLELLGLLTSKETKEHLI